MKEFETTVRKQRIGYNKNGKELTTGRISNKNLKEFIEKKVKVKIEVV